MFLLKKILAALILPPAGLLIVALLGLWLIARHQGRQRTFGIVLISAALSALLALSIPAVGQRLLASLERFPPISNEQLGQVQAIVVLGGGMNFDAPEYGGDTVNFYTLERLRYAARLARASHLPILVTGGAPAGGSAEAQAMREILTREFGVAVKWTESASLDTAENAHFSAPPLKAAGITRIALVSHGWHLPRAVPLFEREGLRVTPAPTAFTKPTPDAVFNWLPNDLRRSRLALNEYLGRAVNVLQDWAAALFGKT